MAQNFPDSPVLNDLATVNGIVYKWNGFAWDIVASSSGISLTDLSVGSEGVASGDGSLGYNDTTGVFTYTPPDLSSYLTATLDADIDLNGNSIVDSELTGFVTSNLRTFETKIQLGGNSDADTYGYAIGQEAQAGIYDVTIGAYAGKNKKTTNNNYSIGIGAFAQQNPNPGDETGTGAIAIGVLAGDANQGENALALGRYAGRNNQATKSIVINATGGDLENITANSCVVKPIRNAAGTHGLEYDPSSGEITYDTLSSGGISELTDLSVTTAAASTTPSLAYDDGTGVFTYTPPDLGSAIVAQSEYSSTITTNASDTSETGSYILGNTGSASVTGSSTGWFFGDIVQDPDNPGTTIILDVDNAIFGPGTTLGNHDGNVRTPTGSHTILDVGTDGTDGTLTITNITADGTLDFSGATVTGVVAGSDTQIQFNNSGSFGADANLIFNSSGQRVVIGSGGTGKLEASNFMGHADQTTYISSKTTGSESTHFALSSTSGVETNIYGFSTFQGSVCFEKQIQEKFSTINAATGTVTHDLDNGQLFKHASPSSDFTVNLTNINLTGDHAMTITIIIEQGSTAFIANAIQVGGAAQTTNWQGGIVPSGTDNGVDVMSFSILNTGTTGSPSYLVLGQLVDFT